MVVDAKRKMKEEDKSSPGISQVSFTLTIRRPCIDDQARHMHSVNNIKRHMHVVTTEPG